MRVTLNSPAPKPERTSIEPGELGVLTRSVTGQLGQEFVGDIVLNYRGKLLSLSSGGFHWPAEYHVRPLRPGETLTIG